MNSREKFKKEIEAFIKANNRYIWLDSIMEMYDKTHKQEIPFHTINSVEARLHRVEEMFVGYLTTREGIAKMSKNDVYEKYETWLKAKGHM